MQLFYCPQIISGENFLSEDESMHCIGVLRHKKGDSIHLVDGAGGYYKTEIIDDNKRKCELRILERKSEYGKRNYQLHIAIAPTKSIDRFEFFLEKATEIGIDEITPLICGHSERKELKTERMKKVLVSAMKQSGKAYLPVINEAIKLNEFISAKSIGQKFICSCEAEKDASLKKFYHKGEDTLILIGPEGDFSKEEITFAEANGFKAITLGKSRLRTETAGVVACSVINFINQ